MSSFGYRQKITDINKATSNQTGKFVQDMSNENQMSDQEALDFYNLATGRLLTGLEVRPHHNTNFQFKIKFQVVMEIRRYWLINHFNKIFKLVNVLNILLVSKQKDLGEAQSSWNWKILIAYFNMIQCLESAGIGLVYGLRYTFDIYTKWKILDISKNGKKFCKRTSKLISSIFQVLQCWKVTRRRHGQIFRDACAHVRILQTSSRDRSTSDF